MIQKYTRESTVANLKDYCYHAKDKDAFMEVTEWVNGEGFDIVINDGRDNKHFTLTYGELDLLNILVTYKESKDESS